MPAHKPAEELFFKKVAQEGECWRWVGAVRPGGHGAFWYEQRVQQAHRVAYLLMVGEIPPGLDLDHLCRNRWCVNPYHLEPVTRSENNRRGLIGYGARDRCISGRHPIRGPEDYYVWSSGDRTCRECAKFQARKSHARRRAARDNAAG